jgi:hypothetical protein
VKILQCNREALVTPWTFAHHKQQIDEKKGKKKERKERMKAS